MKPPCSPGSSQKRLTLPDSVAAEVALLDGDSCILDIDHFSKTLATMKAKGVRPDLIFSIISHYAPKCLPELSASASAGKPASPADGSMVSWLKKRFVVETLVGLLPSEKEPVPCSFLLRLLRVALIVGASEESVTALEVRVAAQLDQAELRDVMIPAFSHTCGTLLDVGLMLRLVRRFAAPPRIDSAPPSATRSGAAMLRAAKLVDAYLAEAALDAAFTIADFEALAGALPTHARANDDGLYRAVDNYIKVHPKMAKQERMALFGLIDTRKLSSDAALHAAQNERLPMRAVIQVLLSEKARLTRPNDWASGSFSGPRSPCGVPALDSELGRVPSMRVVISQQQEMRRLREDVVRLQLQGRVMQDQIDRLSSERRKSGGGFFRWSTFLFRSGSPDDVEKAEAYEIGIERQTPVRGKKVRLVQGRTTPPNKWRNSMS